MNTHHGEGGVERTNPSRLRAVHFLLGALTGVLVVVSLQLAVSVYRKTMMALGSVTVLEVNHPNKPEYRVILLADSGGGITPYVNDVYRQSNTVVCAGVHGYFTAIDVAWSADSSVVAFGQQSTCSDVFRATSGYDFKTRSIVRGNEIATRLANGGGTNYVVQIDVGTTDCGRRPTWQEWRELLRLRGESDL